LALFISFAQFGFGLSNGAYVLYLLNIFTKGAYPMSMYTIATALMMLGISLGGAVSGFVQSLLGYNGFFLWIIMINLGLVVMAFYRRN
jgi:MFS transporter, PAT family, beta-lactamase induction signal transducer AmpG